MGKVRGVFSGTNGNLLTIVGEYSRFHRRSAGVDTEE
jgi:hypothetical protein